MWLLENFILYLWLADFPQEQWWLGSRDILEHHVMIGDLPSTGFYPTLPQKADLNYSYWLAPWFFGFWMGSPKGERERLRRGCWLPWLPAQVTQAGRVSLLRGPGWWPSPLNSLSPSFDNLLLPWHLRLPIAILQAATLSFVISLHPAHIFANNPLTKPSQIIQFECAMCFLPDSYKILLWTAPRNQIPRNTWSRRKTHSKEQVRLPGTYPLPRFPQQDEGLSPSCAE